MRIKRNTPAVLIRCDGSHSLGLGHVVRCLALASALAEKNCQVVFAMVDSELGAAAVREAGFPVEHQTGFNGDADAYTRWLQLLLGKTRAVTLVLDIRDDLPVDWLRQIRVGGTLLATIDDPSERRLAVDLAFYPPVPQVQQMNWSAFTGQLYVGWDWILLRPEFAVRQPRRLLPQKVKLLITMGGSDPAGLTLKAIKTLKYVKYSINLLIVLGRGFSFREELVQLLSQYPHPFTIYDHVRDMAQLMRQSDLALASFGVTAYELTALGVPAVYLGLTEEHVIACQALVAAEAAVCLGEHAQVTEDALGVAVARLAGDSDKLRQMSKKALALIDGRGACRIAETIVKQISKEAGE